MYPTFPSYFLHWDRRTFNFSPRPRGTSFFDRIEGNNVNMAKGVTNSPALLPYAPFLTPPAKEGLHPDPGSSPDVETPDPLRSVNLVSAANNSDPLKTLFKLTNRQLAPMLPARGERKRRLDRRKSGDKDLPAPHSCLGMGGGGEGHERLETKNLAAQ